VLGILTADPTLTGQRPGQTLIAGRHYCGAAFEAELASRQIRLLRPARKAKPERASVRLFRPLRQTIESIDQALKGRLDLERHGAPPPG
jgi:hypothetical protein